MSSSGDQIRQTILDAGLEIYRSDGEVIRLAERVRMHLMESGVEVVAGEAPRIRLFVRCERSNHPTSSDESLFERVRGGMADATAAQGFTETGTRARKILHPTDDAQVLDVWFEVTYEKASSAATLVEDLRWALSQTRCID